MKILFKKITYSNYLVLFKNKNINKIIYNIIKKLKLRK